MLKISSDLTKTVIETFNEEKSLFFRKGSVIFQENEPAAGVYFIKNGKVKIVKSGAESENKILLFAGNGDFLGLHSIINGHNYSNSAIAIEETEACFIDKEEFLKTISSDINNKMMVMKLLCNKIDKIENQMQSINDKSASGRLAESLLFLLETYGVKNDNFVNISLSAEDLANLTGTSKSYLIKIISEFNNNNWIYMNGSDIKIIDKEKLKEISGL